METIQAEVHQIFQFHRRLFRVVQAKIIHKVIHLNGMHNRHRHNKVIIGDLQEVVIIPVPEHIQAATKDAKIAVEEAAATVAIHVSYFIATNPYEIY